MTHSRTLADFVASLSYDVLPPDVAARARQLLLDTLGVGIAGTRHENFDNALAAIRSIPGSAGDTPVLAQTEGLTPPFAAMANGVACHVLDYDDTHTASIVHGSAILTPLVLSLAGEVRATGAELLTAFVAGWEVAARVGIASGNSFHRRGFHSTAVAGIFGATAAAGKLLGLTGAQLTHALGLCGSQAGGVTEFLANNSSSKGFHAGWAAHGGMIAAYFGQAGATGPETIFEGKNGLFSTHGNPDQADIAQVSAELGARWEILRVSIKPYPCCHFAHGAIDCAMALRADGVEAGQITNIHAIVDEVAAGFIASPIEEKYTPGNAYGAKFSLPYLVACGLIDGGVDQASFTPDAITRTDLLNLARKVTFENAEEGATGFPVYFPGHLIVTTTDGRIIEKRVAINRGNPDAPLSDSEVGNKFQANVVDVVNADQAQAILTALLELDKAADCSALLDAVTGRG